MRAPRLLSVLLWAVIAGAFIGPGTVATAATAGARHGLELLWAVLFSTGTCLLLQEAAARLTTATGRGSG
jgi:manganese transport protein